MVLKSKWDIYKVEDICAEGDGAISIGPFGSRLKSNEYTETGIPVIRGKNISDSPGFDGDFVYISEEKADSLGASNVYENELVFPHRGAIGEVGIINDQKRYVLSSSLMKLKCNQEFVNPRYVYYFFKSRLGRHELLKNSSQVGTPGIGQPLTSLKNIDIPIPPKSFQDKVDHYLTTIDQKIHLNQQINETLEAMAQAIFKSWFVDFDPVHAKIRAIAEGYDPTRAAMAIIAGISLEQDWEDIEAALTQKLDRMTETQRTQVHNTAELFPDELVGSEIGMVPKGWEVKALDEIADYLNGRAMQKYPPEDGKPTLPVLKIAQLRQGDTDGADIATADIPERFKIRNGDMIFSWSGSLLIRLWAGGDAALNQHLFKVTSEEYDQWFYYHWTKHYLDNFIRIAESKAVTMGHIKRSHLNEANCAIPSNELLEVGGQHIKPLLQQSVKLNLQSNQLAELRDTLLPKLISGEVEV